MYDVLHSGTNKYNEIVIHRLGLFDNHNEIDYNLDDLSNLSLCLVLVFSDKPGHG